jgi:hypothetical protein
MLGALLPLLLVAATPAPGRSAALASTPRSTLVTRVAPPPRLTVGDRFDVTLTVTAPNHSLVTGPLTDSTGVFAVAREERKTAIRPATDVSTYRLSLAGFRAGRQRLPVFVFLVQTGASIDTLKSDTASVTITSVLPATMQDIHPLAPPEAFPNRLLWIIPLALLLLAALAWFGIRLYRRLRRIQSLGEPPLPPWEEALAALEAMPWREWLAAGQVKRYYYALSQVLKRYIERRFEFDAVEQTTTEILLSMRTHRTPMRDEIARFFNRYDIVKYAKWEPPTDEAESAIAQVREFVVKTRPDEPVSPAADAIAPIGSKGPGAGAGSRPVAASGAA